MGRLSKGGTRGDVVGGARGGRRRWSCALGLRCWPHARSVGSTMSNSGLFHG